MRRTAFQMLTGLGLILFSALTLAQDFAIDWWTIDGGGQMASTGGDYQLAGTIGQPDARTQAMSGGTFALRGGFWVIPECPAIPADYDGDCDVDQADFAVFEACASGAGVPYTGDCARADFDPDGDVDETDFGVFQRCISGQDNPADPNCAN